MVKDSTDHSLWLLHFSQKPNLGKRRVVNKAIGVLTILLQSSNRLCSTFSEKDGYWLQVTGRSQIAG